MELTVRNNEMREFFAEKADSYDDVHGAADFMSAKRAVTAALPEGTRRVLDLGAGTGLELIALFERFPDAAVTAVDITEEMLAELKKRPFADRVTTVCGDFFAVDFGSGYDAVISSAALHHFNHGEKTALYEKIAASLADGGVFINCDKTAPSREEEERLMAIYEAHDYDCPHFDTPLCAGSETDLLLGAGFRTVSIRSDVGKSKYVCFTACL